MLRASRSPFEGGVNGREFQDDESCQLLLSISIGSILHSALSFLNTHRRSCLGRFKRIGTNVHSGLDQSFVVSSPGAEMRIVVVLRPHSKRFRCMVDQQSKLHWFSPLGQLTSAFIGAYPYDARELVHSTAFRKSAGISSTVKGVCGS